MPIPLKGDRSARDTTTYSTLHASDIEDGDFTFHLPWPTDSGRGIASTASGWASAMLFANPMSASGDLITGSTSGSVVRLGIGTEGHVLTACAGVPIWKAASGFTNPMSASGDIIIGSAAGAPARLGLGASGYVLTASNSGPVWAFPARITQTIFAFQGEASAISGSLRLMNSLGVPATITKVALTVNTAPTGCALIVDLHDSSGTTIFTTASNQPRIIDGASAGNTTIIEVPSWADGEFLTVDIDQIGACAAGNDLLVHVVHTY